MLKATATGLSLLLLVACTSVKKDNAEASKMPEAAPQVQTGRYTSTQVGATAAQLSPLNAIIRTEMPRDVTTVREAMDYLLMRTGYRLASASAGDPALQGLYALPLPQVHRTLGPITVRDALSVLAGDAFVLVVDPLHRLVSFDVRDPYQDARHRR